MRPSDSNPANAPVVMLPTADEPEPEALDEDEIPNSTKKGLGPKGPGLARGSAEANAPDAIAAKGADQALAPTLQPVQGLDQTVEATGHQATDFGDLLVVPRDNYVIGEEIARGGMGRIVQARDRRLGRAIAIKELLSPNPHLEQRFEREMRITAGLQHPGIISVLEAGRWPTGQAFYTMTLVVGRPLEDVIASTMTLAERLALLPNIRAVSEAIAYAHEEGVIHRDLKPGNVLVGEFGETIVIDWGLAKRLGHDEVEESEEHDDASPQVQDGEPLTILGRAMGTPAYMPPAQARGEALDERADVYAVGAILYHLLSGQMPYAGAHSAQQILRGVIGGPPTPLRELVPDVPADLEAIVDKAMARQEQERYVNAVGLAEDLRRFETGQLVGAHRYTPSALLRRWLRRHRAATTVGLAMVVFLALFGVWSFQRISAERDRAESSRNTTEETMDFMLGDLRQKLEPIGRLDLLKLVADRVANYYAERPIDWKRTDEVINRSSALRNVGDVLLGLGDLESAQRHYEDSLGLRRRLATRHPGRLDLQQALAIGHKRMGNALQEQGNLADAMTHFESARLIVEALVEEEPDDPQWRASLAVTYEKLGYARKMQGDLPGALTMYARALPISAALAKSEPDDTHRQHELSVSYLGVGDLRWTQQDAEGALREYEAARAIAQSLAEKDLKNANWQENFATCNSRVGNAQLAMKELNKALETFQTTVEIRKRLSELDPANTGWEAAYAFSFKEIADVLHAQGKLVEAVASYRRFISMSGRLAEKDPTNIRLQSLVSTGYLQLGKALFEQQEFSESIAALKVSLSIQERLVAKDSANADWRVGLMNGYLTAASTLRDRDLPEARRYAKRCTETYSTLQASLAASYLVASCFVLTNRPNEALDALERAVELGWDDAESLGADVGLAPLHSDPRWTALLERISADPDRD